MTQPGVPAWLQGSHCIPHLLEANWDWCFIRKGKAILLEDWESDRLSEMLRKHRWTAV